MTLEEILVSAARLQQIVPDTVLVGGTAAAVHAGHRLSTDHDHVLVDLDARFDAVLENLEALSEWSTARAIPGKLIFGSLGGIETGIRQLLRSRPLEVERITVGEGAVVTIPTMPEILRIKAWLTLTRNQTRDYLDLAAVGDRIGITGAAATLSRIGAYYDDIFGGDEDIVSQLVRQLADPRPRDVGVTSELASYKGLDPRWHDWAAVEDVCGEIAQHMVSAS